jgi:hypothetical protein
LASDPTTLEAALHSFADTKPGVLASTPAGRIAVAIGDAHSVALDIGAEACVAYDPSIASDAIADNIALMDEVGPLRAWAAMALATYRHSDGEPEGRLLFAFPGLDTGALTDELVARERLARDGLGAYSGEPYSETTYVVGDASLEGDLVRIDLEPIDASLKTFRRSVLTRDLPISHMWLMGTPRGGSRRVRT